MPLRGICTGGGNGATATASSRILTYPAGAVAGDVCVIYTMTNTNSTTVSATGYTVLSQGDATASGHVTSLLWRALTSSDITAGSVTVNWNSTGRVLAYGAVIAASSVDAPAYFGQASGATLAAPTVTTTVASEDVYTFSSTRSASGAPPTMTYPTGWTAQTVTATALASGANFGAVVGTLNTPGAAGSYGGESIGISNSSQPASSYTVAIRPAVLVLHGTRSTTRAPSALLVQVTGLTVHGARSASRAPSVVLSQSSALTVHGDRSASRAGHPVLTQTSALTVHGDRSAARAGHPVLTQATALTLHGSRGATRASLPALGQVSGLTTHGARSATRSGRPSVSQASALAAHGARAAGRAGRPLLTQVSPATVHGLRAAARAGTALLTQVSALTAHGARAPTRADAPRVRIQPTATPELRTYHVPAEDRSYPVPAEDRTYTVPAEDRALAITAN